MPPSGYQPHGSAVINQDGLELWLHCKDGVVPHENLGCSFLPPFAKWKCLDGVCTQDPSGTYSTQAECEAARTLLFTGGQCVGTSYGVSVKAWVEQVGGGRVVDLTVTSSGLGAISGIYVEEVAPTPSDSRWGYRLIVAYASGSFIYGLYSAIFRAGAYGVENIVITGTPDNCGDKYACG
jgi:hypothetical protein